MRDGGSDSRNSSNAKNMKSEREYRQDIVEVCRRMYEREYISGGDGNVSIRVGSDRILSTSSGVNKGFINARDVIVTDLSGKKLQGDGKPTTEIFLHIEAYKKREDIRSVIHAHPPYTIAFSIAGLKLPQCVMPEIIMIFGAIPTTPYATPCTMEGPEVISGLIGNCDAMILERHGTITVGETVFSAYDKLEKVEHSAHVSAIARGLGPVKPLPREEIRKLEELRDKLGIKGKAYPCNNCGMCEDGRGEKVAADTVEKISAEIANSLSRRFR
jgi:L-fuculose-phosphate aldolase